MPPPKLRTMPVTLADARLPQQEVVEACRVEGIHISAFALSVLPTKLTRLPTTPHTTITR
jgi:hypothetical protein